MRGAGRDDADLKRARYRALVLAGCASQVAMRCRGPVSFRRAMQQMGALRAEHAGLAFDRRGFRRSIWWSLPDYSVPVRIQEVG